MRWILGNGYDPYETIVKIGPHPIIHFLKIYDTEIIFTWSILKYIPSTIFIICILHLFGKSLFK